MTGRSPAIVAAAAAALGLGVLGVLGVLVAPGCNGSAPEPRTTIGLHRVAVGEHELFVEIAADPTKREVGLMYRRELPADGGMLFVFPRPQPQSFWMADCLIDLDIAYIDDSGTIVDILRMEAPPPGTPRHRIKVRYPSSEPVRYALETNAGWFEARGIRPGAAVEGYRGPSGLRVQ